MSTAEGNVCQMALLQPLLHQIMQWVPSHMLEQGLDVPTAHSLWYRTKYTPRLIDGKYLPNNSGCHA